MSIELPGFSRPHPWVSPLHLACRYGQAPIAHLLLKRGASANGAGAAAFAPKSPLEVWIMGMEAVGLHTALAPRSRPTGGAYRRGLKWLGAGGCRCVEPFVWTASREEGIDGPLSSLSLDPDVCRVIPSYLQAHMLLAHSMLVRGPVLCMLQPPVLQRAVPLPASPPSQEALSYARSNCQSYSVLCDQLGYKKVRHLAHLDESTPEAIAAQSAGLDAYYAQLPEMLSAGLGLLEKVGGTAMASAATMVASRVASVTSRAVSITKSVGPYMPSTLALFGAEDLAGVAIPSMNPVALGKEANAQFSAAMDWFDPMKAPLKAVCLAGG